ncbi:MAG: aspartyl protease family protein [Chitinophagaceae bacterium]|nr:aspartyl protease family protein [Chitinophagaceae bacterium]
MFVFINRYAVALSVHDSLLNKQLLFLPKIMIPVPGSDSVSCVIPFSRAGNLILIKAKADTTEGNFILDTGAPGLVLNITYFRNYPAVAVLNEEHSGITGSVDMVTRSQVAQLGFGCVQVNAFPADLISMGHLENSKGVRILGLLGLSLFKQFEMIIDYENSLLYLHRIAKKEAASYKSPMLNDPSAYSTVPIEIWNNKMVTRTTLAGKKLRLIIDSGAESNLLDSRLPNKVFENVEIIKRVQLAGAGQRKVEALYGNLNNLTIGDQQTGTMPVIIANLEKTCLVDNSCIDGILGFDFLSLRKIGFNFVRNKMYIWK